MPSNYSYKEDYGKQEIKLVLPKKLFICEGDKVILQAADGIWPPQCVQWQVTKNKKCPEWKDLRGENDPCLVFIARERDHLNQYRAIVKSKCECFITNSTTLEVGFIEVIKNPVSIPFKQGEIAMFMAKANGRPEPSIQWQVSQDGGQTWENLEGETSDTLSFVMENGQQNNLYRAVFRNKCGQVISRPAVLVFNSNLGTEFWLTFSTNLSSSVLSLLITGPTITEGQVEIPGLAFSQSFMVNSGMVTTIVIPSTAALNNSDTITDLGIHVTADSNIAVYGLNILEGTSDGYLGIPINTLGTEYIVQAWVNSAFIGTEFAIVSTQDNTTITIIPSVTTDGRVAGVPYDIMMNQGQTYQLRNNVDAPNDLSGSIITSDKPISVFGGHRCGNVPTTASFCDYLVEQMIPTSTWGKRFLTVPLVRQNPGDVFRYLAKEDGTNVFVNGIMIASLNKAEFFEQTLTTSSVITSDNPILVVQYATGSSVGGDLGDPTEIIVPSTEQYLFNYNFAVPAGFDDDFINVAAPTSSINGLTLDGVPVNPVDFSPIPGSLFSGAQIPVTDGAHQMIGTQPFGVIVYGLGDGSSYGYPAGLSLCPIH